MIIPIFKTNLFSLHLIQQEMGLDLDARSWFFTYSYKLDSQMNMLDWLVEIPYFCLQTAYA